MIPRLPRVLATVLVYTAIVIVLVFLILDHRPGAVQLDHPVRRVAAGDPRGHRHGRRAVPGVARLDRPRPGRPGDPGPGRPRQPRRAGRPARPRSRRSPSPASAPSGRCSSCSSCRSTWSSTATRSWPSSSGSCRRPTPRRRASCRRRWRARSVGSCAARRSWASSTSGSRWHAPRVLGLELTALSSTAAGS